MSADKPQNIIKYIEWLRNRHGIKNSDSNLRPTYYDSVTNKIARDFETSELWLEIMNSISKYADEYRVGTGYPLLMSHLEPKLLIKSFDSFLFKTYRKNVIENSHWPSEPEDGWILPTNWYSRINDIIRTLIVVKYIDGVEFITNKIQSLCSQYSLECKIFLEAREEGYYAAHLYTEKEFEIPMVEWDTKKVKVTIEIQITTQLQDVIKKLLHKYYQNRRQKIKGIGTKWQWNYKDDEFAANYLGHILHYLEGMIIEIREKQKEET